MSIEWSDLTEGEQRNLLWLYKKKGGRLDTTALRSLEDKRLIIIEDSPGRCDLEMRAAARKLARENTVGE